MSLAPHRPWILRPAPLLWITGVLLLLVSGFFITGWLILPRVDPRWTVRNSPFYGPAFIAAQLSYRYDFLERVEDWRSTALADATQRLGGSHVEAARLAAEVVAKLDPPDATEILAIGITFPDPKVLRDVARLMKKDRAEAYVPALISALQKHTDVAVFDAALAIANLLGEHHYPLTKSLRTSGIARDRALAASVLCRLTTPESVQFIISQVGAYTAEYPPDKLIWDPAIIALIRNPSDLAKQRFCSELAAPDARRRLDALRAVHSQWCKDEIVERAVLPCLEDPESQIAKGAAQLVINRISPICLKGYDQLLSKDLPGSALLFSKRSNQPRREQVPVLIRHLDHPRLHQEILNAVLPRVLDYDHLFEQFMGEFSKMPLARRQQLVSSAAIVDDNLTTDQTERWRRIQHSASHPSETTAPPQRPTAEEPESITPPAPPADR